MAGLTARTDAFDELAGLLGPGSVLTMEEQRLSRARDCWPQSLAWDRAQLKTHAPSAVILPRDEAAVSRVLRWCARREVALVPRGAGSGVLGAAVPSPGRVAVLDLSALTGVFELKTDGPEPVVRATAGLLGCELESRLNEKGWSLQHFPQSMDVSSVGGWIATDGYGQLSTRYGGVGRQARGVRAALPGGVLIDEDARVHLGAEGTLGVLTEVSLRVRRLPASRAFFSAGFSSSGEALAFAREAMRSAVPPSVLRLYGPMDAFFNGLLRDANPSDATAWRLRAEPFVLRHRFLFSALAPLLGRRWVAVLVYENEEPFGAGRPPSGGLPLGEGPARRWWERRYHLSKMRLEGLFARGCFADTVDLWAPWELLARLEQGVIGNLREHALAFSHFSHFDERGACLYVTFAGAQGPAEHALAWKAAMDAAVQLGADVNHHHGVGLAKLPWLRWARSESWLSRWQAEKTSRDPQGLLNPGKFRP